MRCLIATCLFLLSSTARAGEISDLYRASGSPPKDVLEVPFDPFGHADRSTTEIPFEPSERADHGITEIGIEHTACFGQCPIYTFIMRSDGTFRYVGEANVAHVGSLTGTIPPGSFDWLARFIRDSGFMQLKDGYSMPITDHPTVYTMVVMNGQRKIVSDYAYAAPSSLSATEVLIDFLLKKASWD